MRSRPAFLTLALAGLCGCYYGDAAALQLSLIRDQRPLAAAHGAETDPVRRTMLASVQPLRRFAADVMQLRPRDAYRGYVAIEGEGLTHVLVACERTRFEPHTWWFPIAGSVEYKSHFSAADAEAEARALEAAGYDVWIGRSRAYSTLGMLRDPVLSTMMRDGALSFMEVLLHELTHARLYVPGQTDFNEQLASFVAERGMRQWLASARFEGTGAGDAYAALLKRRQRLEGEFRGAVVTLEALYAQGLPEQKVLSARARVFARLSARLSDHLRALGRDPADADLRINNARLMQWRRYDSDAELFGGLWRRARGSWPRFWRLTEAHVGSL